MHFRHAENIVCIATDVEGPIADSEARYMTEYLIEDEGKITSKKNVGDQAEEIHLQRGNNARK